MNKRLLAIADWVLAQDDCAVVADIGTDHGLLPFYLAEKRPEMKILATDLSRVAIEILRPKIAAKTNIELKVGFGFNPIPLAEIDICVLAGLGSQKIVNILKQDDWRKKSYIFQVKENPLILRQWIRDNRYFVAREQIVFEKKHYYHTIFVTKTTGRRIAGETDLLFGPFRDTKNDLIFKKYWTEQLKFKQEIIKMIPNQPQTATVKAEIDAISAVLKND